MSIFDMLRKAWKDSAGTTPDGPSDAPADAPAPAASSPRPRAADPPAGGSIEDRVKRQAAELAAKQALAAAKAAVAAAGDELLDDLEGELARGQEARQDREAVGPDGAVADEIARRVEAASERSETLRTSRADREARAREELARLKAEMDAARQASEARGPALPTADDDTETP